MPSAQSLWIDEAQTWSFASVPTVGGLFSELSTTKKSEGLMPLGMLAAWLEIRVLGTGEWQLRATNILWAAAATGAFFVLGRRWRVPWAPLFLAVQPFLWYYVNEARPYVLQMAASAWLLAGFVSCVEDRRLDRSVLIVLLVSSCVLVATVLFGILTAGPVCLLVVWFAWRERWPLAKGWKIAVVFAFVWSALLGLYYLRAVTHGAAGAKLWDVGLQNVAFAFYEFLGMSGLGPSRYEIRAMARSGGIGGVLQGFPPSAYAAMATLALCYLAAAITFLRGRGKSDRRMLWIIGGLAALSGGSLVVLALAAHFPFWGRHLAPAFPFFCGFLVLVLRDLKARNKTLAAVVVFAFFILLGISSWALRLSPRHGKDDYRGAAAAAQRALKEGRTVWWCADMETARYYGIPSVDDREMPGSIVFANGLSAETLAGLPPPDLILLSKPDIFDANGVVAHYARQRGFVSDGRLHAFETLSPSH